MASRRNTLHARRRQTAPVEPHGQPRPLRLGLTALLALVIVAAGAWAYSTSFAGVFVLDDNYAILDNPNIKTLWPLTRAMSAPPENPVSARPVASLTLAINYALAPEDARNVMRPGRDPASAERFLRNLWGYHFLNLMVHALAALALFGVVRRTLLSDRLRPRFGAASTPLAFVVALVWMVHPILTDAVTYIVQRTEVLFGLFCLLTLYCAIRAGARGVTARMRRWWTAAAILACALGMGSKQTMLSAPLLVWLWDWMFGTSEPESAGDVPRPTSSRWTLYAGLAATWVILAALVAHERWPHSVGLNREGWTPWTYLLTQTKVIVHYLRLSVVPWPLVLDYDGWPMARSLLDVAPYAALLAVVLAATVFAVARRQPWGYVGAWCFAILAPSSSLLPLPTEVVAERRMYLPLAGLVALAVLAAFAIGQRLLNRVVADARWRRLAGRIAAAVLAGGVAVTLGSLTSARNRDFWSDQRIWEDTVRKRPTNPRARINYGVDLSAAGRYEEAEQQLREAVRLRDTSAAAHGNLGSVLCTLGKLDEGIRHLERALALDPEYTDAYPNLGEAYAAQGKRALAARYFALAVGVAPDNPFLLSRLGWLLATSPEDAVRNGARAVELGEKTVRLTARQDTMSLETLAAAYAEAGRFDDAVAVAREALALAGRQGNQAMVSELNGWLSVLAAGQKLREKN